MSLGSATSASPFPQAAGLEVSIASRAEKLPTNLETQIGLIQDHSRQLKDGKASEAVLRQSLLLDQPKLDRGQEKIISKTDRQNGVFLATQGTASAQASSTPITKRSFIDAIATKVQQEFDSFKPFEDFAFKQGLEGTEQLRTDTGIGAYLSIFEALDSFTKINAETSVQETGAILNDIAEKSSSGDQLDAIEKQYQSKYLATEAA